jgi:hypothetical protein
MGAPTRDSAGCSAVTTHEWVPLAERISALWPPAMRSSAIGAYFDVLEHLPAEAVRRAVDVIASTSRERRPPAGLILETARAGQESRAALSASGVTPRDVLTGDQHQAAMAEIRRTMSAEHLRRHAAVMQLLRIHGVRIPLPELRELMPEAKCSAQEFDRRIAGFTPADQLALKGQR